MTALRLVLGGVLAFALGWWVMRSPLAETTATTLSWSVADLQSIGQLRVLATRISIFETATALDPGRRYAGVVPVSLVLGLDLSKARLEGDRLLLPGIAYLSKTIDADPAARFDWDARGSQQEPGEQVSLPRLAELQALKSAMDEAQHLGLPQQARTRALALVRAWLEAGGMGHVRVECPGG